MFFDKDESTNARTENPYMVFYRERCLAEKTANPIWNDVTTFLHAAISIGDSKLIQEILQDPEFDVNAKNKEGQSLLRCAIYHNNFHVVQALLERKVIATLDDFYYAACLKKGAIAWIMSFATPAASNPTEIEQLSKLIKPTLHENRILIPCLIAKGAKIDNFSGIGIYGQLAYLYCDKSIKRTIFDSAAGAYALIEQHIECTNIYHYNLAKDLFIAVLKSYTNSFKPSCKKWAEALLTIIINEKNNLSVYTLQEKVRAYCIHNQTEYLRNHAATEHTFSLLLDFLSSGFVAYTIEKNQRAKQALLKEGLKDFVLIEENSSEDPNMIPLSSFDKL
jgi:ankyrin repeat protein